MIKHRELMLSSDARRLAEGIKTVYSNKKPGDW